MRSMLAPPHPLPVRILLYFLDALRLLLCFRLHFVFLLCLLPCLLLRRLPPVILQLLIGNSPIGLAGIRP